MELKVVFESNEKLELAFNGRLDVAGTAQIEARFFGFLNHLHKQASINFREVSFISSLGIRLLLQGWKMQQREGFKMIVSDCKPEILKVLQIAGLEDILA
ncbi:MAG: STAS domain-containing protein [Bacteroidota bacterium]